MPKIDTEIRRFVEQGYKEATRILTEKRADLEALAKGLLEFETLTGDEIQDLLKGKKPNRESVLEPTAPRTSASIVCAVASEIFCWRDT